VFQFEGAITLEPIYCPCNTQVPISAQATCLQCKQVLLTTSELRNKLQDTERQIEHLKGQSFKLQTELFIREHRRTNTDIYGHQVATPKVWNSNLKARKPRRDYKAEALAALEMI
jgi:hypothetical protein